MFYHEVKFYRKARNAQGCVLVSKVIGCDAKTIDEAYRDRTIVQKTYGKTLVEIVTKQA